MSQDNVVRPVFGKKAQPARAVTQPEGSPAPKADVSDDYKHIGPLEGEALKRARIDLVYMLANGDFVNAMRDKLETAGDTIFARRISFLTSTASSCAAKG